ncbi:MAG: trypsin-like peptidase domain-containing protein [Oscillospiraceae bacterium]
MENEKNAYPEELYGGALRDPREVVLTFALDQTETQSLYVSDWQLPRIAPPPPPVKKTSRRGLWIFLGCMALILTLATVTLLLSWRWYQRESYHAAPLDENSGEITIESYPLGGDVRLIPSAEHGAALSAQSIYRKVNPAVVTVMAQLSDGMSVGTGIIFTEDGYALTNYHVVEGGHSCSVALSTGKIYTASYVAGDAINDIAVLKIQAEHLPVAEIGDSDALVVGEKVYAIGNPLGVELRGTLTDGIVSAINRDVLVDGRTMTLVQTNAALNSGNSGGPLINSYGQVVGINTIKMSSAYDSIEGLGFALPISSIAYLVNDLIVFGKVQPEAVLGITVRPLATLLPDGTQGLEVYEVTGGGAKAVHPGDIILGAEGEPVQTSADLLRIRRRFDVEETLTLQILRDGKPMDVPVTLIPSPVG